MSSCDDDDDVGDDDDVPVVVVVAQTELLCLLDAAPQPLPIVGVVDVSVVVRPVVLVRAFWRAARMRKKKHDSRLFFSHLFYYSSSFLLYFSSFSAFVVRSFVRSFVRSRGRKPHEEEKRRKEKTGIPCLRGKRA